MKKIAVAVIVLSFGLFGCTGRQGIQSNQNGEERIEVTVNEGENGRIVTVDLYVDGMILMTYEYFDGEVRAELGEMSGEPLRARVAILHGGVIVIFYFNDRNITKGYVVIGSSGSVEVECSDSEEAAQRCEEAQGRWIPIYIRLDLERRVARALGQ